MSNDTTVQKIDLDFLILADFRKVPRRVSLSCGIWTVAYQRGNLEG